MSNRRLPTPDQIAEAERLCEEATGGEWKWVRISGSCDIAAYDRGIGMAYRDWDANFIAQARILLPEYIQHVKTLMDSLRSLQEEAKKAVSLAREEMKMCGRCRTSMVYIGLGQFLRNLEGDKP